jgi:hypothetical protein
VNKTIDNVIQWFTLFDTHNVFSILVHQGDGKSLKIDEVYSLYPDCATVNVELVVASNK